jgi:hypothetical protein
VRPDHRCFGYGGDSPDPSVRSVDPVGGDSSGDSADGKSPDNRSGDAPDDTGGHYGSGYASGG